MKRMTKRMLSLLLCSVMVFTMLPATVRAESIPSNYIFDVSEGNIIIDNGTEIGTLKVTYGTGEAVSFPSTQTITIIGTTTTHNIVVESGVMAMIKLADVNITLGGSAFNNKGTVDLTLVGDNILKSESENTALMVASGSSISIDGTGAVNATGDLGIGGDGGTITINGGTVNANGGWYGNGIIGGTITINGGTVNTTSLMGGGGIIGETITINGGTVNAAGSPDGGQGINAGTVIINGGTVTTPNTPPIGVGVFNRDSQEISQNVVTLPGISAVTEVIGLTVSGASYYGTNDLYTDKDGNLFLWLPEDAFVTQARTSNTAFNRNASTGDLEVDTIAPMVTDVTPTSAGAYTAGSVTITFNEEMRTSVGTVSLNGTTLTGGSWNIDNTVFTIPYSGLSGNTYYTVNITGFEDCSGNVMAANQSNSFTTAPSSDASLSSLNLSTGLLLPAFVSGTHTYTATVSNSISTLTMTPTSNDSNASIKVNGIDVVSGAASSQLPLSVGANTVTILVTAEDSTTTQTYTVIITRESGGSFGGNPSGGNNTTNSTAATDQPKDEPGQPFLAALPITPTVDTSGHATVTIPQQALEDTIARALADAKAQGNTANGISISLMIDLPDTTTSFDITLSPIVLKSLINADVKQFRLSNSIATLSPDLEALKDLLKQTSGDVTLTIKPLAKLAKTIANSNDRVAVQSPIVRDTGLIQSLSKGDNKLIGTRPIYDISLSYIKNGKSANITSLGKGKALVSIAYSPAKDEAPGGLYGVSVDAKGNATRITDSVFDANRGCISFTTSNLAPYGIGYTQTKKFSDIGNHWAKESIDYVVGRGLFGGVKDKFKPNTAITRGEFVTAIGKLAGVDTKSYTKSSFTDVTADSHYLPYIEWANSLNILTGISDQLFAPDKAITREEIALILVNYAKVIGYKLPAIRAAVTFEDEATIDGTYKAAVTTLQQAGILMGMRNNRFNPTWNTTRAEASAMLHRYVKLVIDPSTTQGWALDDVGQYSYYKDDKAVSGTQTIDGVKYFFASNGILQTGWVKDGDNQRYYTGNKLIVGWMDLRGKRYYFAKNGLMVSDKWLKLSGKWYYFYADGSLARSTKVDGYTVDKNGVRKAK